MLTKYVSVADASKMAGVGTPTLLVFFTAWMAWLRKTQCTKHIRLLSGDYLQSIMNMYAKVGFPGAVCSTDGTRVLWLGQMASQQW